MDAIPIDAGPEPAEPGSTDRGLWVGLAGPPEPTSDPLDVARNGSAQDKWVLAGEEGLDDQVLDFLVHSGDTHIAASLGENSAVPPWALEKLARLHPEHRLWIGMNPEAPTHLKDAVPIADHSTYALSRYCQQRETTDEVRDELFRRYEEAPHQGGPLLGDVWREITTRGNRPS